jgi:hypothetical protein
MNDRFRREWDSLGELPVPAEALHGIHTARALENFALAGRALHPALARAYGDVKLACARANRALGAWANHPAKAEAIEHACRELSEGKLTGHIVVDALQGGAGTSTNMNVNEVLANRALEILRDGRSGVATACRHSSVPEPRLASSRDQHGIHPPSPQPSPPGRGRPGCRVWARRGRQSYPPRAKSSSRPQPRLVC